MISDDVYKYFMLQADLWQAAMSWLRNHVKDTEYQSVPYKINYIHLVDGGCIDFNVTFLVDDDEINESYRIPIKELENV